jgi:FkbM family methyltransferase
MFNGAETALNNIEVTSAVGPSPWPEDRLNLVDVGGAGGLQPKWLRLADKITPILFEPNPTEAAKLRTTLASQVSAGVVIEAALSHVAGMRQLNVTKYWGCTSLLHPNPDVLSNYRIGPAFRVVGTEQVNCIRYDTLYGEGRVPVPDVIKIDVQGYEYEVLLGFGSLLQNCLAIQLEAHVYPIYRDQKLLHNLIQFLSDFGFVLRAVSPVGNFDGDVVEVDAWFTKSIEHWKDLDDGQKRKFALACDVWNIVDYKKITAVQSHNHVAPS